MPRPNMAPNYGIQKRIIVRHEVKVRPGGFAKVWEIDKSGNLISSEWTYCREFFQEISKNIRRMFFSHTRKKSFNIAAFIYQVETKLAIYPRTRIGPTQRNNISWAWVSPWWTKTSMRRSLFTALLRAGQRYAPSKDNFEEALFSNIFTRQTEYAVRRFMQGHTKYTGRIKGWYNQFRWGGGTQYYQDRPTKEQVDLLLIKPD